MKKLTMLVIIPIMSANIALAAGVLPRDGKGISVQGCVWNGALTRILTVASTVIDMTENLCWQIMSPVACKVRTLPSATKNSNVPTTIFDFQPTQNLTSRATPFVNLSGCTGAELQMQSEPNP